MERSLPDPRHAFQNELQLIKRQLRQARSRQAWPGKVQQTPLSSTVVSSTNAFDAADYATTASLRLDPGAWTILARATFQASLVATTGLEQIYVRLVTATGAATGAVIDAVQVVPGIDPPAVATQARWPITVFGLVTLEEVDEIWLQVEVVASVAAYPVDWEHKMMATPV